jgi:hypothetical protein
MIMVDVNVKSIDTYTENNRAIRVKIYTCNQYKCDQIEPIFGRFGLLFKNMFHTWFVADISRLQKWFDVDIFPFKLRFG